MPSYDIGSADVHDKVLEVNDNAWIVGKALITRHDSKPAEPYWEDDQGFYFTMAEGPVPSPPMQRVSDSCPITDALRSSGKFGGTYKIGNAYLSIANDFGAREHNTLEALRERNYDFVLPTVYCHAAFRGQYYIVHSITPGKSLAEVWPTTKDIALKKKWAVQIADAYHQLSQWHGDRICGADGGELKHHWPHRNFSETNDYKSYTHEIFLRNFKEMGLDCSEFVFAHNCMQPFSFTVDESQDRLGIMMWNNAGFVPKDWVCTMVIANPIDEASQLVRYHQWAQDDISEWRHLIYCALMDKGFRELWEKQAIWRGGRTS
ncbi:hypothetical protein ACHAO7_000068 [Fusarium culmorum]